eukprot:Seg13080.1 transcript_id=Seg13080.1/GoldUCD/mRNA.D3Y31 product="hypothetical protein" protein_id=Seg13080.1/GoldUCD/D3Y31
MYTSTAKGKTYNILEQLTEAHENQGKMLVLDSGFPTLSLKEVQRTSGIPALCQHNRGKQLSSHPVMLTLLIKVKNFARCYSKTLYKGFVTITYWNDNNAVCFVDNDIDSRQESWETTSVINREGDSQRGK